MTLRYGIDTSILVRLISGLPENGFQECLRRMTGLVEGKHAEVVASSQVIGETYVALQFHYGVSKADARDGLLAALTSGMVDPLRGDAVLDALRARTGCGLVDRLIAGDYQGSGLVTLTLDRKMASLPGAQLL